MVISRRQGRTHNGEKTRDSDWCCGRCCDHHRIVIYNGQPGEQSYKVVHHVATDLRYKLARQGKTAKWPFKEIRLVVPAYSKRKDRKLVNFRPNELPGYVVYPYCARAFAVSAGLELRRALADAGKTIESSLPVKIRFSTLRDAFPAMQIWGVDRCLILCSVGINDKTGATQPGEPIRSIAQAMPIGIGMRKIIRTGNNVFDLSDSLDRICHYFDADPFKENGDGIEEWCFCPDGTMKIDRWQSWPGRERASELIDAADECGDNTFRQEVSKETPLDSIDIGKEEIRNVLACLNKLAKTPADYRPRSD